MSRRAGYETTSYAGPGYEGRRETMAGVQGADIGRPRGAAARASAGRQDRGQDDGELQRMQMRTRLLELAARP